MELPRLILASGSPRRSEILGFVGWQFDKQVADIDETPREGESPETYVERLAREKSLAVAERSPDSLVLGADTTVVVDGRIVGKPLDMDDAREMISDLSGRWHDVITGVAVTKTSRNGDAPVTRSAIQTTGVKFCDLSAEEIEFLVREGEPMDKAGAYAVQAQAALFIEEIRGDYWNVVGLPVSLVYELVRSF
ncbi:MAG: septum formation inhibitor Maf [Acidobacteria bacterium]|nr:MAG: septum formation inhibitor Maf [Acidobacteriota bacterium]REK02596.1 MAG: septum formation inhibitor Maf [Acidobacteriota bacterium]REK13601.1 MAG: septum formation inhibitor Maf [Acidobacteriota bacterium]REK41595.1 MAG: septum formation inhibitor Maf [Acidobacteriota bacterium]